MDISRIKKKLAELENQNTTSSGDGGKTGFLWKPTPGKHLVRILPYRHNPDWAFLELAFHYTVAGRSMLAPRSLDPQAEDPIEEFASKLMNTGSKEDWVKGRSLKPKQRIYLPILVRGQEHEGVKFWGFSQTTYGDIMKIMDDEDYGDISDLRKGHDLTIESEAATDSNKYGSINVRPKPTKTPVISKELSETPEGKAVIESIKTMPTIDEVFPIPTYDDLKEALERYLNKLDKEEGEEDETISFKDSKQQGKTGSKAAGSNSVEKSKSSTAGKKDKEKDTSWLDEDGDKGAVDKAGNLGATFDSLFSE